MPGRARADVERPERPLDERRGLKRCTVESPSSSPTPNLGDDNTPAGRACQRLPQNSPRRGQLSQGRVSEGHPDGAPSSATLPTGKPNAVPATVIMRVTSPNCDSTRDTSPSSPCATQTASRPTVIPVGVRSSRAIVAVAVRVAGSTCVSDRSSTLPTQTEPAPAATGRDRSPPRPRRRSRSSASR